MNLHHPNWDREGRRSPRTEVLWELAQKWELELVTPWGEPTRVRHGHRDSTIDHIWASSGLTVGYEGDAELEGSDHRAQAAKINTAKLEKGPSPRGWAWAMMDRSIVQAEASTITVPSGLTTTEELDTAADRLIAELSTIADHSTPRRRQGSGEGVAWWSREVEEATRDARRARRQLSGEPVKPHVRTVAGGESSPEIDNRQIETAPVAEDSSKSACGE